MACVHHDGGIAYTTGFGKSIILLMAKGPPHNGNEDFMNFLYKR
jgi:hypothetical protein